MGKRPRTRSARSGRSPTGWAARSSTSIATRVQLIANQPAVRADRSWSLEERLVTAGHAPPRTLDLETVLTTIVAKAVRFGILRTPSGINSVPAACKALNHFLQVHGSGSSPAASIRLK